MVRRTPFYMQEFRGIGWLSCGRAPLARAVAPKRLYENPKTSSLGWDVLGSSPRLLGVGPGDGGTGLGFEEGEPIPALDPLSTLFLVLSEINPVLSRINLEAVSFFSGSFF